MSVLRFEVKEEHLKLVKQLKWHMNGDNIIQTCVKDEDGVSPSPFGGDDLIEDLGTIIYGKTDDFDPFEDEKILYDDDQIKELTQLYEDLPTVLAIVMETGKFEAGKYRCRFHVGDWKKEK